MFINLYTLCILFTIIFIDLLSMYVSNRFNSKITATSRWFFIHTFVNLVITITTMPDLIDCLREPFSCTSEMLAISHIGYEIAKISHIYHMVFFYKYLTYYEWLHHIIMCIICTPLNELYNKNKSCVASLWFLSGLPGFIDYFLLYLTKINKFTPRQEKIIYLYLTTLIRSPGCIIITYIQYLNMRNVVMFDEMIGRILLMLIVFWNAQYFMYITIRDTTRKLHL